MGAARVQWRHSPRRLMLPSTMSTPLMGRPHPKGNGGEQKMMERGLMTWSASLEMAASMLATAVMSARL